MGPIQVSPTCAPNLGKFRRQRAREVSTGLSPTCALNTPTLEALEFAMKKSPVLRTSPFSTARKRAFGAGLLRLRFACAHLARMQTAGIFEHFSRRRIRGKSSTWIRATLTR